MSQKNADSEDFLSLTVFRSLRQTGARLRWEGVSLIPATIGSVLVAAVGHSAAAVQAFLSVAQSPPPGVWGEHLFLLLLISFGLGCIVSLNRGAFAGYLCYSIQIVVCIIVGYGQGPALWLRLILLVTLLCEAAFLFPNIHAIAAFHAVVIATLLFPLRPVRAWDRILPAPAPVDRFSAMVLLAAIGGALLAAAGFREKWATERHVAAQHHNSVLRLTSANVNFQDYALHVRDESMGNERHRIARELHDSIGYTLTNLVMMMEASQDLLSDGHRRVSELLRAARNHAQEGISEMRRTLRELRAIETGPLACVPAINRLARGFETATGVGVNVHFRNLPWALDSQTTVILCRMMQEGLTNAFRHGKATDVIVTFWYGNGGVRVTIQDNGVGSPEIKEGIGLQGMRERIEPLGGSVHIESLQTGTQISAWIPCGLQES